MRSSVPAERHRARRLALDILYQADVSQIDPLVVLDQRRALDQEISPFAEELVRGVAAHRESWTR